MSQAHLHLILTHIPILGIPAALLLLLWGLWKRSQDLKEVALVVFLVCGLLTWPAKETGEKAEDQIERIPEFSKSLVHEHEEMAEKATLLSQILAVSSLLALVASRRGQLPKPATAIIVVLAAGSSALLFYTGALGGPIRHSEIRGESSVPMPASGPNTERSEPAREEHD